MTARALKPLLNAVVREAILQSEDDKRYWAAVRELWARREIEILEAVYDWAASRNPGLRALVPDVLRGLGGTSGASPPYLEETLTLFREMLARERHPDVIAAIGFANTDLADPRMAALLLPFKGHAEAAVREAVVHCLSTCPSSEAVAALLAMTRDCAVDVRGWATFWLANHLGGSGDEDDLTDGPEVRKALWERTKDASPDVRADAVLGLAQRRDLDVEPLVSAALEGTGPEEPQYIEAAEVLRKPSLYAPLLRLKSSGWGKSDTLLGKQLTVALKACAPNKN